jgi:hypothetical protein
MIKPGHKYFEVVMHLGRAPGARNRAIFEYVKKD